jgi:putative N-acetylmannosamine-6-phosphate epimerase
MQELADCGGSVELDRLGGGLIVSCQPVPGGPMDRADMVVGFALAALAGGARALRIESTAYVATVRAATDAPIVGIIKRDVADSPVRITPLLADVEALAGAGADIVAFDATLRARPVGVAEIVKAIRASGRVPMADCSNEIDAREALAAGAEILASTLSGYTGGTEPSEPDYALVEAMRKMTPRVVAEGRIRTPIEAGEALRRGAWAVTVGSAITRPEHVTAWFCSALAAAVPGGAA